MGNVAPPPTLRFFFQIDGATAPPARENGAQPAVFGTPYNESFPHMLWKFQTHFTQGQVTRSRQVISLQQKFECSL